MKVPNRWRTAGLVACALIIGTIIGPPLARAATAGLVRLEGGGSSNVAKVNSAGRLSVNAGLATTAAGQVKSALASPAQTVAAEARTPTCNAGGFYTIPKGKALVITGATFLNTAVTTGMPHQLELVAGPAAAPCTGSAFVLTAAGAPSSEDFTTQNQVFCPGIAVPAGDALALFAGANDRGSLLAYGYLVPASAVPSGGLQHLRAPRAPLGIQPRH